MNHLLLLVGAYLTLVNPRIDRVGHNLQEWEKFKNEHSKNYESGQVETLRRMIYSFNSREIEDFNEKLSEELGFELGLNHLADWSNLEVRSTNGFKLPKDHETKLKNSPEAERFLASIIENNSTDVPDEVDWRKVPGRVSRVKNQGQCGSCWAFSSVGVLEGQEYRRNNKSFSGADLVELSEQNLVDCVEADMGCQGGIMADALELVSKEGGIDDERSYPYEAKTKSCRFRKDKVAFSDKGYAILPEGDEQKLKEVVSKFGPVAVAIDASSIWFQLYHKGVYYNKHCRNGSSDLDHAVLVVGYGTDPKKGDYWIVKNSWGPKYGEQGYIRMARNRKNNCGIATMATIPIF